MQGARAQTKCPKKEIFSKLHVLPPVSLRDASTSTPVEKLFLFCRRKSVVNGESIRGMPPGIAYRSPVSAASSPSTISYE